MCSTVLSGTINHIADTLSCMLPAVEPSPGKVQHIFTTVKGKVCGVSLTPWQDLYFTVLSHNVSIANQGRQVLSYFRQHLPWLKSVLQELGHVPSLATISMRFNHWAHLLDSDFKKRMYDHETSNFNMQARHLPVQTGEDAWRQAHHRLFTGIAWIIYDDTRQRFKKQNNESFIGK